MNPGLLEVIKGDHIQGANGYMLKLKQEGKSKFSVRIGGKAVHAELVGDQIVWDDGDVWLLVQDQACNEKEDSEVDAALWIAEVRRVSADREEYTENEARQAEAERTKADPSLQVQEVAATGGITTGAIAEPAAEPAPSMECHVSAECPAGIGISS